MKFYYICDEEFSDMRDHMIKTIKDKENFEIIEIPINSPQFNSECPDFLKHGGGIDIWKLRLSYILDIIKRSEPNEYFIFSDVDIVFYRPLLPAIQRTINGEDVLFLREFYDYEQKIKDTLNTPHRIQDGNINFGFNIIKSCPKTIKFFSNILDMVNQTGIWEQSLINTVLYTHSDCDLTWNLLPPEFFSTSVGLHHIHKEIKDVVLYHANCAVKKETKYQYMRHIDNVINQRL